MDALDSCHSELQHNEGIASARGHATTIFIVPHLCEIGNPNYAVYLLLLFILIIEVKYQRSTIPEP